MFLGGTNYALYALGIDRPDNFTARIPSNLFEGVKGEPRPILKDVLDWFISSFMWLITLATAPF